MRCSLCNKEVTFPYKLEKYDIKGYLCGKCYSKKLREIYNIKY